MLSSIHPLGERARSNRWSLTLGAFAVGSIAAGGVLGLTAATLGRLVGLPRTSMVLPIAVIALAGIADLLGVSVPTPHRQVNERWIGTYRGWVYGLGFGVQLGAGFATYVVSWALPALMFVLAWIGDPTAGAVVGALFGAGRSIPLAAAGWIDRPDRLATFHRAVASLARPVRFASAALLLTLSMASVVAA